MVGVALVRVAAMLVGLPDFDQGTFGGLAVFVNDLAPAEDDLALGLLFRRLLVV